MTLKEVLTLILLIICVLGLITCIVGLSYSIFKCEFSGFGITEIKTKVKKGQDIDDTTVEYCSKDWKKESVYDYLMKNGYKKIVKSTPTKGHVYGVATIKTEDGTRYDWYTSRNRSFQDIDKDAALDLQKKIGEDVTYNSVENIWTKGNK